MATCSWNRIYEDCPFHKELQQRHKRQQERQRQKRQQDNDNSDNDDDWDDWDDYYDNYNYYDVSDCWCDYECRDIFKAIKRNCDPCLKKFAPTQLYHRKGGVTVLGYFVYMESKYMCCRYTHLDMVKDLIDNFGLDLTRSSNIIEHCLSHRSILLASYLYLKGSITIPDPRIFKSFIANLDLYFKWHKVDQELLLQFAHKDPCFSYQELKTIALNKGIWDDISFLIDTPIKEPE